MVQIIDYLQCKGYKDTGLVFQPESGQQNAMNKQDLLEVKFVSNRTCDSTSHDACVYFYFTF